MNYREDPENTQREIGNDVRNILKGKEIQKRGSRENAEQRRTGRRPSQADTSGNGRRTQPGSSASSRRTQPGRSEAFGRGTKENRSAGRTAVRSQRTNDPPPQPPEKKRHRGKAYVFVSYAFVAIFLLLIGHMIYFNIFLKDDIMNSPYNKRQNSAAQYVIRGNIESEDGDVLARTDTDSEGNETRVYPEGNVFAHVVGFASHGKSGLESKENYELLTSHSNPIDQIVNEFQGKKNQGDTVVSTLNSSLQKTAYSALGDYQGAVVALDPETGNIKAMVSKPDFDPNSIDSEWDSITSDSNNSQLVNRATQGLYAPGSTFKIVTALTYYRKHGSFDDFHYTCTGSLQVGNIVVHCYDGTAHGEENLDEAFTHSCNTAFSEIGLDVGASNLTNTAEDLLFGKSLPDVVTTSKSRWKLSSNPGDAELVQTAFGQGQTLVTPYHMALIVSSVANGGILMRPNLVDHVENDAGDTVRTSSAGQYRRLMTEDEASALDTLMKDVVQNGTGRGLSGQSYTAAGKTGSAEYNRSDGSRGTHSWFVGYGEMNGQKLVVAVLAEDGGAGSETAVPIAKEVFDSYFG